MPLCIYHPKFLEKVGCSLIYKEDHREYFSWFAPAFTLKDKPKEVAKQIRQSLAIHIHPDGFDYWIDILKVLHEQHALPVKVFVITGSDYPLRDEHLEYWFGLFPTVHFFVQNYLGNHPQVTLFPIGTFYPTTIQTTEKSRDLVISQFDANNSEERFLLVKYLDSTPSLNSYRLGFLKNEAYLEELKKARFSVCPKGNGYDTMRFWESLAMGAIPIVLANEFTRNLAIKYPGLPFVMLPNWADLEAWVQEQDLSFLYQQMRTQFNDLSPLSLSTWISKLSTYLTVPETSLPNMRE